MDKTKILKLHRLLKLAEEKKTNEGAVLKVVGSFAVGEEVFVENEEGNDVSAPDGTYTTDDMVITVQSGIISGIQQVEQESVEQNEEKKAELEDESHKEEEEKPAEETSEVDNLKAEIEALKAENEELKTKLAEAEAKLAQPSAEEINEKSEKFQQETSEKHNTVADLIKRARK